MSDLEFRSIAPSEREVFERLAIEYFREMNPNFAPHEDWKESYAAGLLTNGDVQLRWIIADGTIAGFVLYGLERHRFLPRTFGMIHEMYIIPEFRRHGLGRRAALIMIEELKQKGVSKILLQVMHGNDAAVRMWKAVGFSEHSAIYTMMIL